MEAREISAGESPPLLARLARISAWLGGIALLLLLLDLLGVPVLDWIRKLFKDIGEVPRRRPSCRQTSEPW